MKKKVYIFIAVGIVACLVSFFLAQRLAPWFYAIYLFMLLTSGTVVLIPNAPLILITMFVQVVAVTLLPTILVFLILLLNDKPLMGAYVNTGWQNIMNWSIVIFVVIISSLMGIGTLFPNLFT